MKIRERLLVPDIWRALAVVAMVVFHAVFLAWYQFNAEVLVLNGPWRWLGRAGGWSFLFLAGWSVWLRHRYQNSPHQNRNPALQAGIKQCLEILAWAGAITILSLIAFPAAPIWWGVLHCLGVSLLVAHIFMAGRSGWRTWGLFFMGFTAIIGAALRSSGSWWSVPLGWPPENYMSVDYYPLLPYAGVVWLAAAGGGIWTKISSRLETFVQPPWPAKKQILWIGKNSLRIYLIHVPILWIILWLLDTLV